MTASGSPSRSSPTTSSPGASSRDCRRCPASRLNHWPSRRCAILYRILFLLYAEASPELAVLPVNVQEYDRGYSLDRLRDLVQVPLTGRHARTGTHLYDSLDLLFALVDGRRQAITTPRSPQTATADTLVTPGLDIQPVARGPVPARGNRVDRRGSPRQRCAATGSADTCCCPRRNAAGTAASSPTPNSGSTSSARCTRG